MVAPARPELVLLGQALARVRVVEMLSSVSPSGAALFGTGLAVGAATVCAVSWLRGAKDDVDPEDESDEDEDEEDDEQQARQLRLRGHPVRDDYDGDETYKMLLIFNMELYKLSSKTGEMKSVKMSPGKAAAQSGHATLGGYRRGTKLCPQAVADWLRIGQMKVVMPRSSAAHAHCRRRLRLRPCVQITLKCPTVEELLALEERCAAAGLNTYLIRDAGHTEIEPGSRTVLAVGPASRAARANPCLAHLRCSAC
jgi:PTH2 family peptidyl-tRNA hydrolase